MGAGERLRDEGIREVGFMSRSSHVALGLDFGTESVRALLVDYRGRQHGSAVVRFPHGQITETLPGTGEELADDWALQHPMDWLNSATRAVRKAMRQAGLPPRAVQSIGVDFTSCTLLPTTADGTPLSELDAFRAEKHAWPKLWKHHGAKKATERINVVAKKRRERWLKRYGGSVGLEWFFPKVLEVIQEAPKVHAAAEVWVEAGDWLVWRLVGGGAADLPRSTCMAGYKALWTGAKGYPSAAFLKAVHPKLERLVDEKMSGRLLAPGQKAGELEPAMARRLGLTPGIPVSAAIIDAHAGVPGAGAAESGTAVLVIGTSSCQMLNSNVEKLIEGVAAVVDGGILPGFYGYEMGQAAVGDAFDWLRRTVGERDFSRLAAEADAIAPGSDGVLCLDWLNGCRTPLMDGDLRGAFTGLTLNHRPAHLYRALLEASAYGLRWNIDVLRGGGVPVRKFIATGGIPHHNPLVVQVYADVLGKTITVHPSEQGPALGSAILGVLAAGKKATGFASPAAAVRAMASPNLRQDGRSARVVQPRRVATRVYEPLYQRYLELAEWLRKF